MCAPRFKPGPPSEEAQVLSDRLKSTITACAMPFDNPRVPDRITLTVQAFSPSQCCAYTRSARRGFYISMQHVLILMATRLMPHLSRWSLLSKTVILYKLVCRVPSSNCSSGIPKSQRPSQRPLSTRRQAIRHARGKSAFRCLSNASRSRTHSACSMGTIQPPFPLGFVRGLTSKMLLHQNDGACGPHRI